MASMVLGAFAAALVWYGAQGVAWTRQTLVSGISVSCPEQLKVIDAKNPFADKFSVQVWGANHGATQYVISVGQFKDPGKVETTEFYGDSVEGFLRPIMNSGNPVVIPALRNELLDGWPGFSITFQTGERQFRTYRVFRTTDRFVEIGAEYKGDSTSGGVDPYLDSLQMSDAGPSKSAEPELKRFPLGKSPISVLLTREPKVETVDVGVKGSPRILYTFEADYLLRLLQVTYLDIPDSTSLSEADQRILREGFTSQALQAYTPTKQKSVDSPVGKDVGMWTSFESSQMSGDVVVFIHGNRIIRLMQVAPPAYKDPATVHAFLHSVEFDSVQKPWAP